MSINISIKLEEKTNSIDKELLLSHRTTKMNYHKEVRVSSYWRERERNGYFRSSKSIVTEVKLVAAFGMGRGQVEWLGGMAHKEALWVANNIRIIDLGSDYTLRICALYECMLQFHKKLI